MGIIKNVITVPDPAPPRAMAYASPSIAGNETPKAARRLTPDLRPGHFSNGHSKAFATLQPGASGDVTVEFSFDINSVKDGDFESWRRDISYILGKTTEGKIARQAGFKDGTEQHGQLQAQYALSIFSYLMTGKFGKFGNMSDVEFDPPDAYEHKAASILTTIVNLESEVIHLQGALVATLKNPNVEAYVTTTFFQFSEDIVTSFVSYGGPIILVDGTQEIITNPGILSHPGD